MPEDLVTPAPPCTHADLDCVNPYEFIRKYECAGCGEVMLCSCDREFGEQFLPHQLDRGRYLESGLEVKVTIGFQDQVCRECRGLAPEAYPKAELYGRSSKILRYYWREIFFETTKRFAAWADQNALDRSKARSEFQDKHAEIEREVIEELKRVHAVAPKYDYDEPSASEVLEAHDVEVLDLRATYVRDENGDRTLITASGSFSSPESLAAAYFSGLGFTAMECESRPFHVLFGVFMWLVIQGLDDELRQLVGFGSRSAFEAGVQSDQIWTFLPPDFGKPGYAQRRSDGLQEHFRLLEDDLTWLFDYWLEPSEDLREYLWAHRLEDVERAKTLVEVLPADVVRRVLRYLVESYWARYVGWPDLFVFDSSGFFFAEVKGTGDRLSLDQKRWIAGNADRLDLPFTLVKIHRDPGVIV